jgi:STE24 endopeptidase
MNAYAVVILGALLLEWGLNVVSSVLNLRALQDTVPDAFADAFDADAYRRSQAYTRTRTRFGLVRSTVFLCLLLAFWFAGGFEALDTLVREWGLGPLATGLAYIGLLALARGAVSLPFRIYSTFVVEERFGFNQTTPATFALDLVKSTGLAVAIGGPLLAAVLWFFRSTGPYGWLYAWAAATAVMLALQFLAPRYLMPLFNDFAPLDDDALRERLLSYADAVDFALDDVFVMDGSRRSSKSNAFFAGFGSNRRVALFDTLLDRHDADELLTVVAHEVGHYKRHHIPQRIAIGVLHTGALFLLLSVFLQVEGLYGAFYVDQPAVHTGLIFFALLYRPVDLLLSLPLNAWSRRHEYEADRFAVETTGRPDAFARALKRLAATNLANLTPHPLTVALHHSHPPLPERIAAIKQAR